MPPKPPKKETEKVPMLSITLGVYEFSINLSIVLIRMSKTDNLLD